MKLDRTMEFEKTVNILGTPWKIKICTEEEEPRFLTLSNCDGFTDWSQRQMVMKFYNDDTSTIKNGLEVYKEVARHEITHAFMYESGLSGSWEHPNVWGHDETTVDWIAHQFHKMEAVINEVEKALEEAYCE